MYKTTLALILGIAISGCASVPMGTSARDAELKTFKVSPDKAAIYIYRNEFMGKAATMDVAIDGKTIGQTASKTYLYIELPPGLHIIRSTAEDIDTIHIDIKAGTLTYVWQEVKVAAFYVGSKLHLVSPEEGRKGVLESRLALTR